MTAADEAERAERALEEVADAWARFDVEAVVAHLSTAVRGFTAAGDQRRAAMTSAQLGDVLANAMGNLTAARAWFARAQRLIADQPPCVEQGWVAVTAMGCEVDDPAELLACAELALDRARRFGDVNLETKALADAGLAHVRSGRLSEGMALLDEAMALACGPADDTDTRSKSVCSFFSACYDAGDFARAQSWAPLLRRNGLIGTDRLAPVYLAGHCDSVQATLLIELGRWDEAEDVLRQADARFEEVLRMPSWHPAIALADLRIRQGRLAEAEALLVGKDQALQALLPAARLHLARGDHELAKIAAGRGLRSIGTDRLRIVELFEVLIAAELAAGDLDAASAACTALTARAADVDVTALRARVTMARARVLAAQGLVSDAVAELETVIVELDPACLPWMRVAAQLDLAELRERTGDTPGARADVDAAVAALAGLDVVLPAAHVAVLERLTGSAPPRASTASLTRDAKWWTVSSGGTSVRLPDSKGLCYLASLIARPGVEQHALDLVDRLEGCGEVDRRALGDAGPLVDARARQAYRHRIEELRADADDALHAGQLEHAEACEAELEQLVRQLAQAFGLGGRDRRAASAAERARLNVTRALRAAISKVAEALPTAGAVLDRRVRTGSYCIFQPDADDEVRWIVQSPVNEVGVA